MAKLLYPQANVQIKGYQESRTADHFYDLVIGNWPFVAQSPADRRYDRLSPTLHDYFFIKALDQVRPGGIVIGITSAGTMDEQGQAVRAHLAKNAELVASFRLPSGAFEKYAGTKVVTDIIILKKRKDALFSAQGSGWLASETFGTPAGTDIRDKSAAGIVIETAWVILNCAGAWLGYSILSMTAGVSTAPKPSQ